MNTEELSEFFKMFSDQSRLSIIKALTEREYCVNDLSDNLKMTQSAVSYQLRILRDNRIVKVRRIAQNAYYSIDDEHISYLINVAETHLKEKEEKGN